MPPIDIITIIIIIKKTPRVPTLNHNKVWDRGVFCLLGVGIGVGRAVSKAETGYDPRSVTVEMKK